MLDRQNDSIPTHQSLLTRLKNWDDQDGWREFFDTYWRLIFSTALQAGLTEDEAQEVVQETILTVAKRFKEGKYEHDPRIGSFKGWLLNTTRWRIHDQFRKRLRTVPMRKRSKLDSARTATTERVPDPASLDLDAIWERDWEQNLTEVAFERVRGQVSPKLFQLFHTHVVRGWPAQKVAEKLHANLAQVYYARHKVSRLIQKEVARLEKKGI